MLNFLASVDSKLALEFLRATRRPPNPGVGITENQERELEAQLAARVAGNDPQMSFQLAEELLKNTPNYQFFSILNNLRSQDPQLGARLVTDAIEKVKAADLLSSYDNVNFTTQLLQYLKTQTAQEADPPKSSD